MRYSIPKERYKSRYTVIDKVEEDRTVTTLDMINLICGGNTGISKVLIDATKLSYLDMTIFLQYFV